MQASLTAKDVEESAARTARRKRREWNEDEMKKGARAVSSALKDTYDKKLWQDDYPSFEAYCKEVLGLSRQRAHQIIGAEGTRQFMIALCAEDSAELAQAAAELNDEQAREIATVPVEKRKQVLVVAKGDAGKSKLTAGHIKQAKARVIEPMSPPDEVKRAIKITESVGPSEIPPNTLNTCPHCKRPY
jgi:hypothetical protein